MLSKENREEDTERDPPLISEDIDV